MGTATRQSDSTGRRGERRGPARDGGPSAGNRAWYWLSQRFLQILWMLLYGVRRSGIENIPAEGPVLLTPNHQSHFDPPLVGCCCPRRVAYMARASLFESGPFAALIRSFGAFPIEREGRGFGGIKETLKRLKRGEVVLMFPEGARTYDGAIQRFRAGVRTLAVRSGATIVPVAIEGAYRAWPRSRSFPGLGTIHVRFGEAIKPEQIVELGEDGLVAEVERRVRRCHEELRRHPLLASHREDGKNAK